MSRAKGESIFSVRETGDQDNSSQSLHLERATDAVERIMLSAYDRRHDDAALVLARIRDRLREATRTLGTP